MRKSIVILTGAGISAESGIGTFRDKGGIWATVDWREVATPEGFARDRGKVLDFYNRRRARARQAEPNAAHLALARMEREWAGRVVVVTQNVDALHERAGTRKLIHMHGEHARALCAGCGFRWPAPEVIGPADACPSCGEAQCRPDVVWFGEVPYQMERIAAEVAQCGTFAAIGTSGEVFPAAGLVRRAREAGAVCVELNLAETARSAWFHERRAGPATEAVPAWVDEVLAGA